MKFEKDMKVLLEQWSKNKSNYLHYTKKVCHTPLAIHNHIFRTQIFQIMKDHKDLKLNVPVTLTL